jgi:hypothetical protein
MQAEGLGPRWGHARVTEAACATPWAMLIVVLIALLVCIAVPLVQASVDVARRATLRSQWQAWERHLAAVEPERAEARRLVDALQTTVVGDRGTVRLTGSAASGALQPTSDFDVKVVAASCADFEPLGAALTAAGFQLVHSGGRFALFSGVSEPSGRAVDVSLEAPVAAGVPGTLPSSEDRPPAVRQAAAFLEHLVRAAHPDMTIRH